MTETTPNTQPTPVLPAFVTNLLWTAYVVIALMVGLMLLEQWRPLIALSALSFVGVAAMLVMARRSDRMVNDAVAPRPVGSSLGHARETRVA